MAAAPRLRYPSRMAIHVLTVEDLFDIPSFGGLIVVPGPLQKDWQTPLEGSAEIRKPDGTIACGSIRLQHVFQTPPPPKEIRWTCVLKGVDKEDVPIGAQVWMVG